jgi:hypothetical protein
MMGRPNAGSKGADTMTERRKMAVKRGRKINSRHRDTLQLRKWCFLFFYRIKKNQKGGEFFDSNGMSIAQYVEGRRIDPFDRSKRTKIEVTIIMKKSSFKNISLTR